MGSTRTLAGVLAPVSAVVCGPDLADATFVGGPPHDAANIVGGGGDLDEDGFDDLVIGAAHDSTDGEQAGAAFIVYAGLRE